MKKIFLSGLGLFLVSTAVLAMNGAAVFDTNQNMEEREEDCNEKLGVDASDFAIRNCMGTTLRKYVDDVKRDIGEEKEDFKEKMEDERKEFEDEMKEESEQVRNKLQEAVSGEEKKEIMEEAKEKRKEMFDEAKEKKAEMIKEVKEKKAEILDESEEKKEELKEKREEMIKKNNIEKIKSLEKRLDFTVRRFNAYGLKVMNISERVESRIGILEEKGYNLSSINDLRDKSLEYADNIDEKIEDIKLKISELNSMSGEDIEMKELVKEIRINFEEGKKEIKAYFSEMKELVKELKIAVREQQDEVENASSSDVSNPASSNVSVEDEENEDDAEENSSNN